MGVLPYFLLLLSSVGKESQLLLKQTEVELGLQVGVEFDNRTSWGLVFDKIHAALKAL